MPHKQAHRGANPKDAALFADKHLPAMRQALQDLHYLLNRDYTLNASLKLVGDRFRLKKRQRQALTHAVATQEAIRNRTQSRVATLKHQTVWLDGYNQLITTEALLAGAPVFRGMDGCLRDIASVHSTYRKVAETLPALQYIGEALQRHEVGKVVWVLDAPISNSGRLAALLREQPWGWEVVLDNNPDKMLVEQNGVVVSSDSWVLDRAGAWFNLSVELAEVIPTPWLVEVSSGTTAKFTL